VKSRLPPFQNLTAGGRPPHPNPRKLCLEEGHAMPCRAPRTDPSNVSDQGCVSPRGSAPPSPPQPKETVSRRGPHHAMPHPQDRPKQCVRPGLRQPTRQRQCPRPPHPNPRKLCPEEGHAMPRHAVPPSGSLLSPHRALCPSLLFITFPDSKICAFVVPTRTNRGGRDGQGE
jgi:hypothetical protein